MTSSIGHNGGPGIDEDEENPFGKEGWIKVARNVRFHAIVGFGKTVKPADPSKGFVYSRAEAWLDLLMECRWQPGSVVNKGRKMEIQPGQLLGAISWLGSRWNWTPMTVRIFLDRLENDRMVARQTDSTQPSDDELINVQRNKRNNKPNNNQANILSLCSYTFYQQAVLAQQQANEQPPQRAGNKLTTSQQQASNNTLRLKDLRTLQHNTPEGPPDDPSEGPLDPSIEVATKALAVLPGVGSETDPAFDDAHRMVEALAKVYPSGAVLDGILDYQAKRQDRTERRILNDRLLLEYVRQSDRSRRQQTPVVVEKPQVSEDESCWFSEDRLMVANGFKTELLELVGGSEQRLRITLDKAAASVPIDLKGPALRKVVRGQFTRHADWHSQDERKVVAVEKRLGPGGGDPATTESREQKWARMRAEKHAKGGN